MKYNPSQEGFSFCMIRLIYMVCIALGMSSCQKEDQQGMAENAVPMNVQSGDTAYYPEVQFNCPGAGIAFTGVAVSIAKVIDSGGGYSYHFGDEHSVLIHVIINAQGEVTHVSGINNYKGFIDPYLTGIINTCNGPQGQAYELIVDNVVMTPGAIQ